MREASFIYNYVNSDVENLLNIMKKHSGEACVVGRWKVDIDRGDSTLSEPQ